MQIECSALGTLPTVIFQRRNLSENGPASMHALVFDSVGAAKAEAELIERQEHLRLIAVVDAVVKIGNG